MFCFSISFQNLSYILKAFILSLGTSGEWEEFILFDSGPGSRTHPSAHISPIAETCSHYLKDG